MPPPAPAEPRLEPALDALHETFRDPPPAYSISPYWFWNGRVTEAETRRQIAEMVAQGVRAVVVFNWTGLEPAYLSEEYWQQVGVALDAARAAGLTLNFADEWLWPSGEAWVYASPEPEPSRVLQLHPEYRMRRLSCRTADAGEDPCAGPAAEAVVAARVDASGAIDASSLTLLPPAEAAGWKAPGPGWKLFIYTLVPAAERGVRVDLMNPAAVRVFIEQVYEPFAQRFPEHLGTTIRFTVSDHEGTYGSPLPYTPALWEEFRARHGYDLRAFLPLADKATPGAARIRRDYLNTVSELYASSLVGQITAWCARHGVEHGHSDIEESIRFQVMWVGDMFRLWRASSIVYFDALIERGRMPVDFQEAASVAHFEGRPLVVENQGLTGMDSYWSLEKARLGTNMCLLWGVNRLMPHYFEYDPDHVQYPPSWFLTQPLWRYFHHYADVGRRGLFMNSTGRHNAQLVIYYPLESAFSNAGSLLSETDRPVFHWGGLMDQTQEYYSALQLELPREGWSFHIMDAHYLAAAAVAGPRLELAGERFSVLILPPMTDIEPASAAKIAAFAAAGGRVLSLGPQPAALDAVPMARFPIREHTLFMDQLDYTTRIRVPAAVRGDLDPLFSAIRAVTPPEVEVIAGGRDNLYFARRFTADLEWFWSVNDSTESRTVTVRFPTAGVFERWDAETGERRTLPSEGREVRLEFGPSDAFFVVRHAGPATAPPVDGDLRRVLLELPAEGWLFTPESPVRVPYASVDGAQEPLWLAPERLANRNWWLAGPYPDRDGLGLFEPFPPEGGFVEGDPAWKWCESPTPAVEPVRLVFGEPLDFHQWSDPHPERSGIYYAFVHVWSPEARPARLAVVAAESVKLWWNGRLELTSRRHFPFIHLRDAWCDRVPVRLEKGWNCVLLKIGRSAAGPTGFLFRITDGENATLRDLVFARERVLKPSVPPRRLHVSVEAPPGTGGGPLALELPEDALPENPYVFTPASSAFTLASWTDSTLAHYSGTALYERRFVLDRLPANGRLRLDLGEVGLAAEVWLNGTKVGERAWRPYVFDLSGAARTGENVLKIRVANSNAGWSAQGPAVYQSDAFWSTNFRTERDRLQTLRPNGLEGPVRILME
jgi:hypothetical protein